MFPKENRLPSYEISLLFRSGKSVSVDGLQLRYAIRMEKTKRFAVVVPLSVSKKAVVRNRMKRLVRESIRQILSILPGGIDAVILIKRSAGLDTIKLMSEKITLLFRNIQ
ncbi:MAG: ribonuclease P protein component [Patescibacteria group bacterium]